MPSELLHLYDAKDFENSVRIRRSFMSGSLDISGILPI